MNKVIQLGATAIVADPCYDIEEEVGVVLLEGLREGDWLCSAKKDAYERTTELVLMHEEYKRKKIEEHIGSIAVDGGAAGVWDATYYSENQKDYKKPINNDWFKAVMRIVLREPYWGTMDDKGVLSDTGYGDGWYPVFVARNKEGEIVGIKIRYIIDLD